MSWRSERLSDSQRGPQCVEGDFFFNLSTLRFCTLLAAYICNSLLMFRDNLLVPSFRVKKSKILFLDFLTLEGGIYHSVMRSIPEERSCLLPRGGSLNSCTLWLSRTWIYPQVQYTLVYILLIPKLLILGEALNISEKILSPSLVSSNKILAEKYLFNW
jgi:hypothetical protein